MSFQAFLTFKISIEKAATILTILLLCVTYLTAPLLLLSFSAYLVVYYDMTKEVLLYLVF